MSNVSDAGNLADDNTTTACNQILVEGKNKKLQQATISSESSVDPTNSRKLNGILCGQLSISSPYIHLSTCYAGKVDYLKILRSILVWGRDILK